VISPFRAHQIAAASAALIADGGAYVDLPTLLPASLVLELAGEGLRPRLFFATAPDGGEMCLRADLTIPAALQYVADAHYDNDPFAWACKGNVFRTPRIGENRPPEFVQIGLERFGDPETIPTDVTIFLAAWHACESADTRGLHVRFCDGGILPAIIAGADLPDIWRAALGEHTGHSRTFLSILSQASSKIPPRPLSALERALVALSPEQARARVDDALQDGDLSLPPGRSLEDVTNRLVTRTRRALAPPLPDDVAHTLRALATFRQERTMQHTLDHVVSLAGQLNVDLAPWCADWAARLEAIAQRAPHALAQCRFDALSHEAFDYYDGMAFDIATSDDFSRPLATGGRYDRLVGDISGGTRHARAIGCVIRPDRFCPDENGDI
jgi:ATP phosphoribosyltransferase regulatory subunit